jgi:hypothetical protein
MQLRLLPLALIAALPLAAQDYELGLFVGQQTYRDQKDATGDNFKFKKSTVVAARFGYSVVDLGPALFQLTAGYQPKVEAKFDLAPGETMEGKLKHEYWSLGVMFNFKSLVAVGAGLEYRSEKLNAENGPQSNSTTYGRPWAKVSFGYAFPLPEVKPFIGLEVAAPLTSQSVSATEFGVDTSKTLKGSAPKLQVGLYGGVRF